MRIQAAVVIALLLAVQPALLCAAGSATSVNLTANPSAIVADGKSVTTITADVRDLSGRPVPDGTLISFSSDAGTIQSTVSTVVGVARVRLTSASTAGTATVSAWATTGGAISQIKVDMLTPGTEIPRQSFVTISSARYLVYDPEKMLIEASGGAKISHRGLTISAADAQIDLSSGTIKCRMASGGEPVHLTRGRKALDVSVLLYKIGDSRGQAMQDDASGKVKKVSFRGSDLVTQPDDSYVPATFFNFADLSDGELLIKASSIVLRPGQELRIKKAQVFVNGKKMLSIPLHVVPVGGTTTEVSRYIGWGTTGLRVDLPYFYSLSANSTGSVRLRRGQQTGWGYYSADQGWALDLVQDYTTDSGGDGGLTLNRVTTPDWGAAWHHTQELGSGGQVYSFFDFAAHKDLFGTTSISKPLGELNLGANFYASKLQGQSSAYSSDLSLQTNPKPIAGGLANYVVRARTAFSSGPSAGVGLAGTGLQMQFTGHPMKFTKTTNMSTSLTVGQTWGSRYAGTSLLGTASVMHRIGNSSGAGLSYSFVKDNGNLGLYGQHRLSGSLFLASSKRWQAEITGTYTLDKPMSSSFANLSYQIFPSWRLSLLQTFQKYNAFAYSDTEIVLGKMIAEHEVDLVWSGSKKNLSVQFAAARF